ncbi:helix-turn-helix domain-containing protein [Pseudomonas cedrina]|uniref:helix-turn-helix domain-containing protein n=1 Tax=Pseudomonas cedrina TaxID=651740 RepID=UPI003EDB229E
MNQKKADQQASHKNTRVHNTSGTGQRARLLDRLQAGLIDIFTAIRKLNIVRSGARINELRGLGHEILTHHFTLTDDQRRTHQGMALYYLSTNPSAQVTA